METRPKKTTANHEIDGQGLEKSILSMTLTVFKGFPSEHTLQDP